MSLSRYSLRCTSLALSCPLALAAPPQVQSEAYRRDLVALCAEEMAGRAAGTPGGERAVAYLVERFAALGLRPAVGDGLRQEFLAPNPLPAVCAPATACALQLPGEDAELRVGVDICPFSFSPDGTARAAVVFAGHGLVIQALGIDDYHGLDVRGKVALVLRGGPRWREPEAPVRAQMPLLSFRAKAANASARGALALIVVDRGDRDGGELDPAAVRAAMGDAGLPMLWLQRKVAARWFVDGEAGLRRAEAALDQGIAAAPLRTGAAVALRVELQRRPSRTTANVLGLLPGAGGEIVVVGAHHDHIGRGEFGSLAPAGDLGKIHPGADDDASGVAALLELARRWRQPGAGKRSIVFAAFGAEELGQLGSRWFLDHLPASGAVVAMIDLNMIGRGRSGELTVYGVGTGVELRPLLSLAAAERHLPALLRERPSWRSDQSVFVGRCVPALLFTTGLHDQYHRPGDVPELVEIDAALRIVDLADDVLRALVDGPRREFVPGSRK